jgi:hypothetical protein
LQIRFEKDKTNKRLIELPDIQPVIYRDGPGYLHINNPRSVGSYKCPTAPAPAAAQTADQITMIWSRSNQNFVELGYDETVGMPAPEGVETYNDRFVDTYPNNGYTGKFLALDVEPHRDDGFPAIITIGGLRKWYKDGKLHRKGSHPAIRADYIGAVWMQDGEECRNTGPSRVLIEGYSEWHREGEYEGHRHNKVWTEWDRLPLEEAHGSVNPLSNRYFGDIQDEMIYAAQKVS